MNNSRMLISLPVVLTASLAASCAMPYRDPLVERIAAENTTVYRSQKAFFGFGASEGSDFQNTGFAGIDSLTRTEGGKGRAILITIHGMCHHDKTWFEASACRLAAAVDEPPPRIAPVAIADGNGVKLWRSEIDLGADRSLRVYGIIYSDLTLAKKKNLCRDVNVETDVCPSEVIRPAGRRIYTRERVSWNAAGKSELMNNCFADAVAYLGEAGNGVREGVRQALKAIASEVAMDTNLGTAPIGVLSESLGSKILSDVLLCSTNREKQALTPFFEPGRVKVVFYGANQIPLLNLGTDGVGCGSGDQSALAEALDAKTVVAFTDPNDLLSYEVHPRDVGGRDVYNVIVSNDWSWFGLGERPDHAHSWYRANPNVIRMIMCGRDEQGNSECGRENTGWLSGWVGAIGDMKRCDRIAHPATVLKAPAAR